MNRAINRAAGLKQQGINFVNSTHSAAVMALMAEGSVHAAPSIERVSRVMAVLF
jgi:hypothetical protein